MANNKHDNDKAPEQPHVGDADPSAVPESAPADNAEKISQETQLDTCELGSIDPSLTEEQKQAAVAEFRALDKQAYDKADELTGEYQKLMRRFDEELLPLADRMQSLLSQRGFMHVVGMPSWTWTAWRDAFLKYLQKKMKMSLSTFKRKLKEYQELDKPEQLTDGETDDSGDEEETTGPPLESPKGLLTKGLKGLRKLVSKGDEEGALVAVDNMQLAIDEGFLDDREPSDRAGALHL